MTAERWAPPDSWAAPDSWAPPVSWAAPLSGAAAAGSDPLVVVWRVTEACDLACVFCRYSREVRIPRRQADPEQILRFGAVLARAGRPVLVSWLGGEPLRWPPLARLARVFQADYGLRLSVTTNGTALASASLRREVAETYAEVTVSLDGRGDFHNRVRRAPGLFAELRRDLPPLAEALAARGALLRVNTILMHSNWRALPNLCRELAGWGVREVTFNALGGLDRPGPFFERERLRPEDAAELARELPGWRAQLALAGLRLRGDAVYAERLQAGARAQAVPALACAPGARFLFIDESGRAGPCHFTSAEYGRPIDELQSPADLEQLPAWLCARRAAQPAAACADCRSTQVFGKFAG